jgi:hypothetical protein
MNRMVRAGFKGERPCKIREIHASNEAVRDIAPLQRHKSASHSDQVWSCAVSSACKPKPDWPGIVRRLADLLPARWLESHPEPRHPPEGTKVS